MKFATWLVWIVGTGSLMGLGQLLVLRRYLPGLSVGRWVPTLILSVAAGWGLSFFTLVMQSVALLPMTAPFTDTYIPGVTPERDINAPLIMLTLTLSLGVVVGFAALLGSIIGFVQGLVLERHVPNARWWIAATMWSWVAGSLAAFIAGATLLFGLIRSVTYDNSTWDWDRLVLVNGGVALFTIAALSCSPLVRLVGNSHAGWAEDTL
ncbi:MAG TPA: hypothetical protein VEX13_18250 [Chloroflexia bacterium]|nr:hypothetical protein [Chloroflexia bacterium]